MFSDWVSFLAYPNLFGIKGFVVVIVDLLVMAWPEILNLYELGILPANYTP
jgi:hypothetical protein